jgi:hypothetical protein
MTHENGGKYSRYTQEGNDKPNWAWKGKFTEMLQAVILDGETTPEEKEQATTILAYCSRKQKAVAHLPELDQKAHAMLGYINASSLWERPDHYEIVIDKDGVEQVKSTPEGDAYIESIVNRHRTPAPTAKPLAPEPPSEVEPTGPLTAAQKLEAARRETRGMLPSLNAAREF